MKGFLPYQTMRINCMNLLCYIRFERTNHMFQTGFSTLQIKNEMDMIWHYNKFIHDSIRKMNLNLLYGFLHNSAKVIFLIDISKYTLLFMGTDGHKIIIAGGIIITL